MTMVVSVITPTLNRLQYLKEAVQSVRWSNPGPLDLRLEHVIHNLGSSDGTREWLDQQDDLVVLHSDHQKPPGLARNEAIQKASGDFLMVLDDDDVLLQRSAHHFVYALRKGDAWAVGDFLRVDHDLRYLLGKDYYSWHFDSCQDMLRGIFNGSHFIQGSKCFRRKLFDQVGGYDPHMTTAEDLDLCVRFLLEGHQPLYVPLVCHLHRMHGDNLSEIVDKDRYNRDLSAIYAKYADRLTVPLETIP